MAVKSIRISTEEVDRRKKVLEEYMDIKLPYVDHMSAEWLLSIVNKIESEAHTNDVVIARRECRIFYGHSKKRIIRSGSTKKQAIWLALSDYCLEKKSIPLSV